MPGYCSPDPDSVPDSCQFGFVSHLLQIRQPTRPIVLLLLKTLASAHCQRLPGMMRAQVPYVLAQSTVFVPIAYWMIRFRATASAFFFFYFVFFLCALIRTIM